MASYVKLLGTAGIRHEGDWLEPPAGKSAAFLYYLAYRGAWVSRDDLVYLFWPDTTEEKARRNLRRLLTSIRTLPYAQDLEAEVTRLRWHVACDVHEFKDALAAGQLGKAAQLYGGELLHGFRLPEAPEFEDWLALERQELHEAWQEAALAFAAELEASRRYAQAGELLERLWKADPLDEEVLRRYLQTLYQSGQRSKALEAFESSRDRLQEELEGEPEGATMRLVERIRQQETLDAPTPATLEPVSPAAAREPRHNLPAQPTPFVGRERERARLAELLRDPAFRLVTLTGPGGIGKTRLAIEAAAEQREAFRHGVYFASFISVGSPEFMVYTIADAIHFSFFGQREPKEQLLDYLEDKEMLLVLDNLEHLLSGVNLISDILEEAPSLQVLATSRERLNLHAERVFDLSGLSYPSPPPPPSPPFPRGALERSDKRGDKAGGDKASPQDYDAIKLFVQSATSVRPDFALDEANLPAVTRICQLAEGMPLAIELAASWLRVLTPEDVAAEIERSLDFLKTSTRDLPERHRSLRAVFDYSWKLLTEEGQVVLRKLSVFQDGFRRKAAAEVAGASLAILASLVDKSFLRTTSDGRYHAHPLVLQYARDKLSEHPREEAGAEEVHGRCYLRFVREREHDLRTRKRKETLRELEAELANIRAAWSWAVASRQAKEIALSTFALGGLYENRIPEGEEAFAHAALALPDPRSRVRLDETDPDHHTALGYVLIQQAEYLWWLTRPQEAERLVRRGLELLEPLGDVQGVMRGQRMLALCRWFYGDFAQIKTMLQEGLSLAREHGAPRDISDFLLNLATIERELGEFPQVRALFEEALAEVQRIGDLVNVVNLKHHFGTYLVQNGLLEEGKRLIWESLELARDIYFQRDEPFILDDLALATYSLGDYDRAEALSRETLAVAERLGTRAARAKALAKLGRVAMARGNYAEAQRYVRESLRLAWARRHAFAVLDALILQSEIYAAQGQALKAAQWLGLVRHQPAFLNEQEFEVRRLLDALQEQLAAEELEEALEDGKSLRLEEVVGELLEGELEG